MSEARLFLVRQSCPIGHTKIICKYVGNMYERNTLKIYVRRGCGFFCHRDCREHRVLCTMGRLGFYSLLQVKKISTGTYPFKKGDEA